MSCSTTIFADRLTNIIVTGPLVRLELSVLHVPETSDNPPQLKPAQVLVMPLEGFVNSFGMLDALMKKLVEDGILTPRTANAVDSPSAIADTAA
jgi:hypothetical protein